MKTFIIFSIAVFIGPLIFVQFIDEIPLIHDLALSDDPNLYAGEGEVCETSISKINCQEGLECTIITEKPYRNAVCLPPGTELDEDLSYKYNYNFSNNERIE